MQDTPWLRISRQLNLTLCWVGSHGQQQIQNHFPWSVLTIFQTIRSKRSAGMWIYLKHGILSRLSISSYTHVYLCPSTDALFILPFSLPCPLIWTVISILLLCGPVQAPFGWCGCTCHCEAGTWEVQTCWKGWQE